MKYEDKDTLKGKGIVLATIPQVHGKVY